MTDAESSIPCTAIRLSLSFGIWACSQQRVARIMDSVWSMSKVLSLLLIASALALPAAPDQSIDLGFRQMYNLDFAEAHRTFGDWKVKHPEDPLGYVSDAAAYLFGEFDRMRVLQSEFFVHDESFTKPKALMPDPAAKQAFLKELETGERLAKDALTKSSDHDLNAMFAWVLTFGLRADYDGLIEKKYLSSV